MAINYKSYMISSDKSSWIPVFNGQSYNTLADVPIKNLYSESEDVYIDIASLKEGSYRLFGYYKLDDDSELKQSGDNPVLASVYIDGEDNTKKYIVMDSVDSNGIKQTIYTIQNSTIVETHEIVQNDTDIPQIHEDIENLGSELTQLSEKVTEDIATSISELADTIDSEFTSVNESLSETNQSLNSNVTRIDSQIAVIDSHLDSHDRSVSEIEDTISSEVSRIDSHLANHDQSVSEIEDTLTLLNNTEVTNGSIRQIAKSYTDALDNTLAAVAKSGSASDVSVDNENFNTSDVESVLGELYDSVTSAVSSSAVTLSTASTPDSNDSTTYILMQGNTEVGRVHIAKDLVATKGELVTEDADGNTGTFIKMTVANGTPFYISVDELVDTYYGSADVGTVSQGIAVNVANGVVSASVVTLDGSKLDEKSVKRISLSQNVQDSLTKADTAVQYTATDRITTKKAINFVLTGQGTEGGQTLDSNTNTETYRPAKWTFNSGLSVNNGDFYIINVPCAGSSNGVYLSIDNGTEYYPVVTRGDLLLENQYTPNSSILVIYESSVSALAYPLNGGSEKVSATGVWRVLNYYDTTNTQELDALVRKTDLLSNTLANLDTYVGTLPNGIQATNVVDYINELADYLTWHNYK